MTRKVDSNHLPSTFLRGREEASARAQRAVRLVVVEDSPSQLKFLEKTLSLEPDLVLAGLFSSAEAAIESVYWPDVDVLLTDLELPGMAGIRLIERLSFRHPTVISLPCTIHDDEETVLAALMAGASGYVIKDSDPARLVTCIREVARGLSPISPGIARHLIAALRPETPRPAAQDLSPRQESVLRLIANGRSYKEIAAELGISRNTVQAHIQDIYDKLHAINRQDAMRRARVLGYLDPRP
jgi:two-component system NarL family response regulator